MVLETTRVYSAGNDVVGCKVQSVTRNCIGYRSIVFFFEVVQVQVLVYTVFILVQDILVPSTVGVLVYTTYW